MDSGKNDCSWAVYDCWALEMPLKGKLWEFAQLEGKKQIPIPIQGNPDKICKLELGSSPLSSLKDSSSELPTGTNSIPFPNQGRQWCPIRWGEDALRLQGEKRAEKCHCSVPHWTAQCVPCHLFLYKILQLSSPRVNGFNLPGGRFGLEIRERFFTILWFHGLPQLPVAAAVLSALPWSPRGACRVYKGKCVLLARLRIKRRPGKNNHKKQTTKSNYEMAWGKAGLQTHLTLKLWQMSHIAARASYGNMAVAGLIWNNK